MLLFKHKETSPLGYTGESGLPGVAYTGESGLFGLSCTGKFGLLGLAYTGEPDHQRGLYGGVHKNLLSLKLASLV